MFIGSETLHRELFLTAAIVIITSDLAASKCAPWMYYLDIYGAHSWTPYWGQIQPLRPMEARGQFDDGGQSPIGYDSGDEKTWHPLLGERWTGRGLTENKAAAVGDGKRDTLIQNVFGYIFLLV